jgi:hypothetical protein
MSIEFTREVPHGAKGPLSKPLNSFLKRSGLHLSIIQWRLKFWGQTNAGQRAGDIALDHPPNKPNGPEPPKRVSKIIYQNRRPLRLDRKMLINATVSAKTTVFDWDSIGFEEPVCEREGR